MRPNRGYWAYVIFLGGALVVAGAVLLAGMATSERLVGIGIGAIVVGLGLGAYAVWKMKNVNSGE